MIYNFFITSQDSKPPYRHFRTGTLVDIVVDNERVRIKEKNLILNKILKDFKSIDRADVTINYYKHEHEPYPDFLTIDFSLCAANLSAQKFLTENEIKFSERSINILNANDVNYNLLTFPIQDLIDINASKLYVKDNGSLVTKGKSYFDSDLVLKKEAKNIQGIFSLDKLYNVFICDEETKKKLEKSGLTGFYFEELGVSQAEGE